MMEGRRVVITGGTEGLGRALVSEFASRGARTGFVARTRERVSAVEREMKGSVGVVADVSKKEDIHPMVIQLGARLGGADVLIHNASSLGPKTLQTIADTECEDFELAFVTNVLGPHRLTRAFLGLLTRSAREGKQSVVVTISSDVAVNAYAAWGAYGSTKAALLHWTLIADEEMRGIGVRFLSIDPGDMDTALHAIALPEADRSTLGRPEDSARIVVDRVEGALAGDAA